jgi:membrane-associated phospholipid phosphatase
MADNAAAHDMPFQLQPGPSAAVTLLRQLDQQAVVRANALSRRWSHGRTVTEVLARRLASVEVALMVWLMARGRHRSGIHMLIGVAVIYALSEALGTLWRRQRPFARLPQVEGLVEHGGGRSFPSRHVASAVAMATIGMRAQPRLGRLMLLVGSVLGLSRVAAGLHYPSDVVAGVALGRVIGQILR